ncbi:MAG: hypothetical protein ACM37W_05975 [Actinomycetota bacterium]
MKPPAKEEEIARVPFIKRLSFPAYEQLKKQQNLIELQFLFCQGRLTKQQKSGRKSPNNSLFFCIVLAISAETPLLKQLIEIEITGLNYLN